MAQPFYNFVNSDYFGVLLFIWVVVDVFWTKRWKSLFQRIGQLIIKPWIFSKDEKPYEPPLYPRSIMEQLVQGRAGNSQPANRMMKWIDAQKELIFSSEHPFAAIGFIVLFLFFLVFVLASAISNAQILVILGVGLGDLPELFDRFDLAVLGGSLASAIVGIWVYFDLSGGENPFSITSPMHEYQRRFWKIVALFLFLSAFVVIESFALLKLIAHGILLSNPTLLIFFDFILYVLVPLNNMVGAALCFLAAPQGFIVLLILIMHIILAVFPVVMFFVDILSRFIYIGIDTVIWFLFTPFMVISVVFSFLKDLLLSFRFMK